MSMADTWPFPNRASAYSGSGSAKGYAVAGVADGVHVGDGAVIDVMVGVTAGVAVNVAEGCVAVAESGLDGAAAGAWVTPAQAVSNNPNKQVRRITGRYNGDRGFMYPPFPDRDPFPPLFYDC
jgi:hypothetical protein